MTLRALSAACACLLVTSGALAQDDATERARVHFEAGTRAFDTGDYELAVREFQEAYDITHHPDLLFNIYSSAERAGQLQRAADALTRFLAEGQVEEERRPVLQERLARLRERVAAQAEPQPEPEPEPEPSVEPEPEPEPPPPSGVHPAGVGVLIAAGVLAASFGVFAALSEVEDGNLAASCSPACSDAEVETLRIYDAIADASWIAAAVAGVTGVILLFALPPERAPAAVALAPFATPSAAGIAAVGRW